MQVDDEAWLIAYHRMWERQEREWLRGLAEFDAARGWEADGQTSCIEWLMHFARMDRSTAREKLRAAHALRDQSATADSGEESATADPSE